MGTRTRLFASAAFPFLSLSLTLQPAHAALLQGSRTAAGMQASVNSQAVQLAQAEAEPADGEQDPRKRKKPQGEEKPEPPKAEQPQEKPAEAPKPPKAAEPEAPRPPKPEAEPAAPKAEQPEAPQPPKKEKPKPAPAEEAAPAEAPAAPKPKAVQPEAAPVKPKASAEPEAPSAEPEAQPQGGKRHKNAQAQPDGEAAPAATPQAQPEESAPKPPKHNQKPANNQDEQVQPQTAPAEPTETPAKPAKPVKPAAEAPVPVTPDAETPAAPKAPGAKPPVKPAANAEQPAEAPPAPAAGQPPAPAEAPAKSGDAAPQAAPSTAGEQVSPAELERRKKIAENPAAAGAGTGPVILPVQNGTAVLDSDKEPSRHRNNGQAVPGGQAQPAPGQAPDGQRPPAPENVRAPTSDADSQRAPDGQRPPPVKIEAVTSERGQRMNQRPDFVAPDGAQFGDRQNNRIIINFGGDTFVRHDDTQRFTRDGEQPTYEQLPRDRYRETIDRPDGTRIVTIRNRYGDIVQRSRVDQDGREYVLFYSPELENRPDQDDYFRDPGDDLPPMRLRIPLNQYIIDTSEDQDQDYYDFLRKPPVEPVERVYSLNEVRYSARIRDKVRRIDLDTITFASGSSDIPMAQAKTLRGIADAIGQIVKKNPSETFLIEGHTDAVGSAQSNLILSDQRAESVANVLTDVYGIPPENLATQGYGEQYLKINTQGPEQENRRVTIRRVTALVRPVASK